MCISPNRKQPISRPSSEIAGALPGSQVGRSGRHDDRPGGGDATNQRSTLTPFKRRAIIYAQANMKLATTNTVFRAFSDPTRLRILSLLLEGELCVCELCEVLRTEQPKISRHLSYLRRAGLVIIRQEGKWKFYSVDTHSGTLQRTLLECVGSCLRQIDVLKKDLTKLRRTNSRQKCKNM